MQSIRLIYKLILSVVAVILATSHTYAQIHDDVPGLSADSYSIYVEDIITGDVIYDYNGDIPFTPASITKSLTTAAVTRLLSPESRFHTEVLITGDVGSDSVLNGDVVVRCYGDPTLGSQRFAGTAICDSVARIISMLDIRKVRGHVVVDTRQRITNGVPLGWQAHDLVERYGAVYAPCNYADNQFSFSYPSLASTPAIGDPKIEYGSKRGKFALSKSPYENKFKVSGKPKRHERHYSFPNSSPHITLALEIEKSLVDAGIDVENSGEVAKQPEQLVYVHRSPTYAEIMRSLMVRSDNMLAEAMLCTLSPDGSRREALRSEQELFADITEEWDQVNLADGSGLSRDNRFPAYFLADVLLHMAQSENGSLYASYFPRAGKEGTVRNFMGDSPLAGQLALKSGSMSGVQCYAGYKLDSTGMPTHVVVVMVNGFNGSRAKLRAKLQETFEEIFLFVG